MSKVTSFSKAGRVCTGFSKPYVADYSESAGVVTIANPVVLARGVNVQIQPDEGSGDNNFYADNQLAESDSGVFTGGTMTLTVDGLHPTAEDKIMGYGAAQSGWTPVGDNQNVPYITTGYVVRYMSGGVTFWRPEIIVKTKYKQISGNYATQEDSINWQTQELSATVMRGDDSNHNWKLLGDDWTSEEEAEAQLVSKMGGTTYSVTQTLSHATSSFTGDTITSGATLQATITADAGYSIDEVTVTMGGTSVPGAWNADTRKVTITTVTGNVSITVTTTTG